MMKTTKLPTDGRGPAVSPGSAVGARLPMKWNGTMTRRLALFVALVAGLSGLLAVPASATTTVTDMGVEISLRDDGQLTISGSDGNDFIVVAGLEDGQAAVGVLDEQALFQYFESGLQFDPSEIDLSGTVTKAIILGRGGDDILIAREVDLAGNLVIAGGHGLDYFLVDGAQVGGELVVSTGPTPAGSRWRLLVVVTSRPCSRTRKIASRRVLRGLLHCP